MSRKPRRFAIVAIIVGALGATGLLRFSVDSGQSLLVGSRSSAGQTYASFSQTFGSDPIVIVFTTQYRDTTGNPIARAASDWLTAALLPHRSCAEASGTSHGAST